MTLAIVSWSPRVSTLLRSIRRVLVRCRGCQGISMAKAKRNKQGRFMARSSTIPIEQEHPMGAEYAKNEVAQRMYRRMLRKCREAYRAMFGMGYV